MDIQVSLHGDKPLSPEELTNLIPGPHALPTSLHVANHGAVDFGTAQQLLAYGAQNLVIIMDIKEVSILQSLNGHKQAVNRVSWSRENYAKSYASGQNATTYSLQLASADLSGSIIIWNVCSGEIRCEFSLAGRAVLELCWMSQQDASKNLLLVLHAGNQLALWNADTGSRIWTRQFSEIGSNSLSTFTIDPFNEQRCALISDESVWLIDDLYVTRPPNHTAQKLSLIENLLLPASSRALSPSSSNSNVQPQNAAVIAKKSSTSQFTGVMQASIQDAGRKIGKSALQRVSNLFTGASNAAADKLPLGDQSYAPVSDFPYGAVDDTSLVQSVASIPVSTIGCVQVLFSRYVRHQLVMVYAREILFIDLQLSLIVSSISTERSSSSPFLHVYSCSDDDALFCLHENATITYRQRPWSNVDADKKTSDLSKPHALLCVTEQPRQFTLPKQAYKFSSLSVNAVGERHAMLILPDGRIFVWQLETDAKPTFVLTGMHTPISSNAHTVRMCPALTMKNSPVYRPLLAVGTNNGHVQIVDLIDNAVVSDVQPLASSVPVRAIEWASMNALICCGFVPATDSDTEAETGRNELVYVDLDSLSHFGLRTTHAVGPLPPREPPIDLLRVNTSRHYLLVLVRSRAVELWSLHTFRCLYELDCQQIAVQALDWAPPKQRGVKERFLLADASNSVRTVTLQHQSSPANNQVSSGGATITIREGRRVPLADAPFVRACALKDELVVFGTADAVLQVWNYELRVFKNFMTSARMSVRKIRFAPGYRNHKLLVLDSDGLLVEVYEIVFTEDKSIQVSCALLGAISFSKPQRCIDADWAAPHVVVLTIADQTTVFSTTARPHVHVQLRLYDDHLQRLNSALAISSRYTEETKLNPYLLCADQRRFPLSRVFSLTHACLFYGKRASNDDLAAELARVLPRDQLALFSDSRKQLIERYSFMVQNAVFTSGEFELQLTRLLMYYIREHRGRVPLSCDSLLKVDDFRALELERLRLHEQLLFTSDMSAAASHWVLEEKQSEFISRSLLVSNNDPTQLRGVLQKLVEMNTPQRRDYLSNAYLTCVLASDRTSDDAQSCVKTVATSLIANGYLLDGIRLLCLIGKHVDACRYLISHKEPDLALWLAKLCLTGDAYTDAVRRVAEYFWNAASDTIAKRKAVLLLVTIGDYDRVLEWLFALKYFDVAFFVYKLLRELNLTAKTSQLLDLSSASANVLLFVRLSVKLEYARMLAAQQQPALARSMLDRIDAVLARLSNRVADEQAETTLSRIRAAIQDVRSLSDKTD